MTDPARCRHWLGADRRYCDASPARLYLSGPRCADHTPAALAGRPEPGQNAYCPPGVCWCGTCPRRRPARSALDALDVVHADARRAGCPDPGHQLATAIADGLRGRQDVA